MEPVKFITRNDVHNYSLTTLLFEIKECKSIVEKVTGINLTGYRYIANISAKMTGTFGRCERIHDKTYRITLNEYYLRHGDVDDIHDTIMHEVIHSVPGCMNHGPKWKACGQLIKAKYPQYVLERTSDSGDTYREQAYQDGNYRFKIKCKNCNKAYYAHNYSKKIRNCLLGRCRCGKCGGDLEVYDNRHEYFSAE